MVDEVTRCIDRVECIDPGGELAKLTAERVALSGIGWFEDECLGGPEPLVQLGEQRGTALGGHHSASAPVGGIRTALDEPGCLEVVEQVGHDRAIDAEMLGQGELATDVRSGGCRQHLVTPWPARQFGHRRVGGGHVGPEDHAQTPPEVICEGISG